MAVLNESTKRSTSNIKTLFEIARPAEKSRLFRDLVKESKGIYTDIIKTNWTDGKNEKTMEPTDRNFKLYKDIYERVGIIKNCVDNTADFALQSGYQLEGPKGSAEKVEKFIKNTDFDLIMHNILKQMQIYGNCFLEINPGTVFDEPKWDLKILPVEQMRVVVSTDPNNDGTVLKYKQITFTGKPIEFDRNNVIHFKWNTATNMFYGISDLRAICGSLTSLLNFQEDIGEIIHRYAAPIIHWKLGTADQPAQAGELTEFISLLNGRDTGQDMVTSANVTANPIVNNLRMVQPDGMIKLLENQLIAGLRVPEIFIRGGETSNKATADVELQAFDRKVKAIREALAIMVEDYIFKKITPTSDVTISWNELSVESEHTKAEMFQWLVNGRIPPTVALKMCGWGSWVNDVEEDMKKNPPQLPLQSQGFPPSPADKKPLGQPNQPQNKPQQIKQSVEPREEDFETQEQWFEAYRKWKTENT